MLDAKSLGSTSSVSCQFLVLESPFIQVIFMKKHTKNPLFEGLYYNLEGLELYSKINFESSWVSEGLKIDRICILCYPFGLFFCPPPLSRRTKSIMLYIKLCVTKFANVKEGGTKKQTKRVAQNTYTINFQPFRHPGRFKIQFWKEL